MATISKNHPAILARALTEICDEKTVWAYCAKHHFDAAECYLNATEIVDPAQLLEALGKAEQEITEKQKAGISILTLFDYQEQIDRVYLYYNGDVKSIFGKKFTVNISHASNVLSVRVEEILENIAMVAPEDLAMVGGASSSFASTVRYHECGRPVVMVAEKTMNNFKSNFADTLVYDMRPSELLPTTVTFDMVDRGGLTQVMADVAGVSVNVTKLGQKRAAQKIVELIMEAK